MNQQPTLFSQGAPVPSRTPDRATDVRGRRAEWPGDRLPSPPAPPPPPDWLQSYMFSLWVVVRIFVGLFVVWLPWMRIWTDEPYLLLFPHLAMVLLNGAFRGIISGIGLLNIWIGIDDAIHYNEP